jgi:hypothetical protein
VKNDEQKSSQNVKKVLDKPLYSCYNLDTELRKEVIKMFKKKEKKIYYAVAFREIDQEEIQVDVMDGHQLGGLHADWAFEVLAVKEVER